MDIATNTASQSINCDKVSYTERSADSINMLHSSLTRLEALMATVYDEPMQEKTNDVLSFSCVAEALHRGPEIIAEIAEAIYKKLGRLEELLF